MSLNQGWGRPNPQAISQQKIFLLQLTVGQISKARLSTLMVSWYKGLLLSSLPSLSVNAFFTRKFTTIRVMLTKPSSCWAGDVWPGLLIVTGDMVEPISLTPMVESETPSKIQTTLEHKRHKQVVLSKEVLKKAADFLHLRRSSPQHFAFTITALVLDKQGTVPVPRDGMHC